MNKKKYKRDTLAEQSVTVNRGTDRAAERKKQKAARDLGSTTSLPFSFLGVP